MTPTDRDFCYTVMVKRLEERYNRDSAMRQQIYELNGRLLAVEDQNARLEKFVRALVQPDEWGHAVPPGLFEQAENLLRFLREMPPVK